ncbi:hypothetical protein VFPPC_17859 [Pochonia chlamydosporia 170]|uniref:Uncharacterized protein n=1 Tax=Pochonia chlamydosporia 170 TaxID=1380566 RepID=A0A219AQ77_METCM|nr:hypothetical protein VFPPC_17859 [Pochonia chlamydosporia 170]OWT42948.1 hypothetical protein VFPPC_17859 [Pochonia chlamydosporia 170]
MVWRNGPVTKISPSVACWDRKTVTASSRRATLQQSLTRSLSLHRLATRLLLLLFISRTALPSSNRGLAAARRRASRTSCRPWWPIDCWPHCRVLFLVGAGDTLRRSRYASFSP